MNRLVSSTRRVGRATSYAVFLSLLLACSGGASSSANPVPLLSLDFENISGGPPNVAPRILTQFSSADVTPGVAGQAWRADGFSSYLEAPLRLSSDGTFTVAMWVALESYPADREVPVSELSRSSLVHQSDQGAGFDLHIDAFGRWGFDVETSSGKISLAAPERFRLYRWVHVAFVVDARGGTVRLYQDGATIAEKRLDGASSVRLANRALTFATPRKETRILDFVVNRINGAYDSVRVYDDALTSAQIGTIYSEADPDRVDVMDSLAVSAERFKGDHHRPAFHPIPPAGWTNEPHGLVMRDGVWHMFYQRTPNGPFKTLMNWGHMSSRDLTTWKHHPDALRPELQTSTFGFDMKGIWSGHVYQEGAKAFAFYTSVNHGLRLADANPGVAMAISEDPNLEVWRKLGPVLNSEGVRDFRDPFVWKEGDTLHMIVGAALDSGGGLAYYTLQSDRNSGRWERRTQFSTFSDRQMDPGSEIWEMPVFMPIGTSEWILLVNPIGGQFSKYGNNATRAQYWIGEWRDGKFHPFEKTPKNLDVLPGHLAPTVAKAMDGSIRAIGIVDERRTPQSQQSAGWAHVFSFPRVWGLLPDGRTLSQKPAPELLKLRSERPADNRAVLVTQDPINVTGASQAFELEFELTKFPATTGVIFFDIMMSSDRNEYTRLAFDRKEQAITLDLSRSGNSSQREGPSQLKGAYDSRAHGEISTIRIFVDGSVVEVFINDTAAFSFRSYPSEKMNTGIRILAEGPTSVEGDLKLWNLVKRQ